MPQVSVLDTVAWAVIDQALGPVDPPATTGQFATVSKAADKVRSHSEPLEILVREA